jgi:hypothetical protein
MHPQTLDVQPDLGENRTGFSITGSLFVFWVITTNPILATCLSDAVFPRMK